MQREHWSHRPKYLQQIPIATAARSKWHRAVSHRPRPERSLLSHVIQAGLLLAATWSFGDAAAHGGSRAPTLAQGLLGTALFILPSAASAQALYSQGVMQESAASARQESAASARSGSKWWGRGSGVSRVEVLAAVPPGGMDLALASGKRHVTSPRIGEVGRTKIELMEGLPLSGCGADIALVGGRRSLAPASPTARTKIQSLRGLPTHGRGADIALAGARRHFPGNAGVRGDSAPPHLAEACSSRLRRSDTAQDLQLLESRRAVGRNLKQASQIQGQAAARKRQGCLHRRRARSIEGLCTKELGIPGAGGIDSPTTGSACTLCAGSAANPPPSSSASPRASGSRSPQVGGLSRSSSEKMVAPQIHHGSNDTIQDGRSSAALEPAGAASSRATDMAEEQCSTPPWPAVLNSSASLAGLKRDLSRNLDLPTSVRSPVNAMSTASRPEEDAAPSLSLIGDDLVHDEMERAWQAICKKLNMPPKTAKHGRQTVGGCRPAGGRAARLAGALPGGSGPEAPWVAKSVNSEEAAQENEAQRHVEQLNNPVAEQQLQMLNARLQVQEPGFALVKVDPTSCTQVPLAVLQGPLEPPRLTYASGTLEPLKAMEGLGHSSISPYMPRGAGAGVIDTRPLLLPRSTVSTGLSNESTASGGISRSSASIVSGDSSRSSLSGTPAANPACLQTGFVDPANHQGPHRSTPVQRIAPKAQSYAQPQLTYIVSTKLEAREALVLWRHHQTAQATQTKIHL